MQDAKGIFHYKLMELFFAIILYRILPQVPEPSDWALCHPVKSAA